MSDLPIEAQKRAYLSRTKEKLMNPVMNAVDLLVREQLKPESITDEEAIELFGIQEAIEKHQASGKSHLYKSFSEFNAEQRSNGGKNANQTSKCRSFKCVCYEYKNTI